MVCNTVHYLLLCLGRAFKDHHFLCLPMMDCYEFWFLVVADLLSSTGFKMNFLVKWTAGGISKFILRSLFFVIRMFSLWLILVCLMLALIESVCDPLCISTFLQVLVPLMLYFSIFYPFLNCSLGRVSKSTFVFPMYIFSQFL